MIRTAQRDDFDTIVVGAGPAGAAAATLLAQAGLRILLCDRATFPRDKPCGEFLSPQAHVILERLGVVEALEAAGARRLAGLSLFDERGRAVRSRYQAFGAFRPHRPWGLGVRRVVLDPILLRRTLDEPRVEAAMPFRVTELVREGGRVTGVRGRLPGGRRATVRAPLVVGADGAHSIVARKAGLVRPPGGPDHFAFVAHFEGVADEGHGEMHVTDGGYTGLAPVDGGLVNVNVILPRRALPRMEGGLERFLRESIARHPGLRDRFHGARLAGKPRGTGPMAVATRSAVAPGVALAGDAAGFVDPFTGEGIYLSLRGAEMLADAVIEAHQNGRPLEGALAVYASHRRRELHGRVRACRTIQGLLRWRQLFYYLHGRLRSRPELGARVIAVSGDYLPPEEVLRAGFFARLLNPFAGGSTMRVPS